MLRTHAYIDVLYEITVIITTASKLTTKDMGPATVFDSATS